MGPHFLMLRNALHHIIVKNTNRLIFFTLLISYVQFLLYHEVLHLHASPILFSENVLFYRPPSSSLY